MSEITGYVEAAEVLNTRQAEFDEASELADQLPESFRVVELSDSGEQKIERETQYNGFWVPVAEFTEPDAKYEWAEEIARETPNEYRCVIDRKDSTVSLEVWHDE